MFGWDDVRLGGCVPMFSSPYVPQSLYSPVPLFPIPGAPRPYIHKSLYSPIPFFPDEVYSILPSIYPPQFLCSQVTMFSDPFRPQYRYAPEVVSRPYVPQIVFPVPVLPNHCSPVPMFPSVHSPFIHLKCFPVHTFLSPYSPSPYVHQKCFPVLMFPKDIPQFPCSPVLIFP